MAEENKNDDTIFVGKKPSMAYVLAAITQFSSGKNEIIIKARGKSISKAVDVSQIIKNKFIPEIKFSKIEIGTDQLETESKDKINVSTIEITLNK